MDSPVIDHLLPRFIEAMRDIGRYGFEKYAEQSFEHRCSLGDTSRGNAGLQSRTSSLAIEAHAAEHFAAYNRGELHDKFGSRRHQLAAVAFNAMMEFWFAGLNEEGQCPGCGSESKVGICQNYGCEGNPW